MNCRTKLKSFLVPEEVVLLGAHPKSLAGKVLKRELRKLQRVYTGRHVGCRLCRWIFQGLIITLMASRSSSWVLKAWAA